MIILVGTGHVFDLVSDLNNFFDMKKPDIICVELDKDRYNILSMRNHDSTRFFNLRKDVPLLYKLFMRFQEKTAKKYGVNPGDEMLAAIDYAQLNQIPYEFIDVNAQELYDGLIRSLSTFEKIKLSILAVSLTVFGWYFNSRKNIDKELERLDENFDKNMEKMQASYPIIKKLVLDDRNEHMAKKIMKLKDKYINIVACVGDGHVVGISRILKSNNIKFEIMRLRSLITN